jgi:hypothetical protein
LPGQDQDKGEIACAGDENKSSRPPPTQQDDPGEEGKYLNAVQAEEMGNAQVAVFRAPAHAGEAGSAIRSAYGMSAIFVDVPVHLMLCSLFRSASEHEASGGRPKYCDQQAEPQ